MTTTEPASTVHSSRPGKLPREITINRDEAFIPVERYTSIDFLNKEIEKLWLNVWQLACREDDVAQPGDYYEYVIGDHSYLIVRGTDERIRAFHNVCRHRANILREGKGNTGTELVCQFHLWSYSLDGSLKSVMDRETFCPFDEAEFGLRPALVDTWGGWVFLHPKPEEAEPLLDFLAPLVEGLGRYHCHHLVPVGMNLTTTISANWKVAVEAFLESYHLPGIHPQVGPAIDDVNTTYEVCGPHSRMFSAWGVPSARLGTVDPAETLQALLGFAERTEEGRTREGVSVEGAAVADPGDRRSSSTGANFDYFAPGAEDDFDPMAMFKELLDDDGEIALPNGVTIPRLLGDYFRRRAAAKGIDFSDLLECEMTDTVVHQIFPNIILSTATSAVMLFRFLPDWKDPNRCSWDITTFEWVTDKEKAEKVRAPHTAFAEKEQTLGLILDQDVYQMPRVQRGLRSGAIDRVILGGHESGILHFNRVIDGYLARGLPLKESGNSGRAESMIH